MSEPGFMGLQDYRDFVGANLRVRPVTCADTIDAGRHTGLPLQFHGNTGSLSYNHVPLKQDTPRLFTGEKPGVRAES